MKNIYLLVLICALGSCKKENARVNNNNNNNPPQYSNDSLFEHTVDLRNYTCGAAFTIAQSVTFPVSHAAATALSNFQNTYSSILYSLFETTLPGDNKILLSQDIGTRVAGLNNVILTVTNATTGSGNFTADSIILYSGGGLFTIKHVQLEITTHITHTNPLAVEFDVRIIKGILLYNSSSYILDDANITFKTLYTYLSTRTCANDCFNGYLGYQYAGTSVFYKSYNKDTVLYILQKDTVTIEYIPPSPISSAAIANFAYLGWLPLNPLECPDLKFWVGDFGSILFASNIQLSHMTTSSSYQIGHLGFDSLNLEFPVTAILKTTDASVLSKNVDTSNYSNYLVAGKYVRIF